MHGAKTAVPKLKLVQSQELGGKKYINKLMLATVVQSANIWDENPLQWVRNFVCCNSNKRYMDTENCQSFHSFILLTGNKMSEEVFELS